MNPEEWRRHRRLNALQTLLLLVAIVLVLGGLGWVLAGATGVIAAFGAAALLVLVNPGVSPRLVLGAYGAREIRPADSPQLVDLMETLARRAGLADTPHLYYVPSRMMNAFAVGERGNAAIAVTDGLLRNMSPREVAGVLAHEMSHVRHNDTRVMGLADLFSRVTSVFSTLGQVLLLVNLPLLLFSGYTLSWSAIAILIFAPAVSALMQLALSRTREHDADLGAVELTGDPRGLASALARMERFQGRVLEQLLLPGAKLPDPSLLRTHPPTEERVQRLLALEARRPAMRYPGRESTLAPGGYPPVHEAPRRRRATGLWY